MSQAPQVGGLSDRLVDGLLDLIGLPDRSPATSPARIALETS